VSLYRPLTIGELSNLIKNASSDQAVIFDFCGQCPVGIDSSRGDYSEPSLLWGERKYVEERKGWGSTVADLRQLLDRAISEEFTGYKGGHYRFNSDSPLWVDNYGEWSATGVVGVQFDHHWFSDTLVLVTAPAELFGERWNGGPQ
jgi:hypothetical protein